MAFPSHSSLSLLLQFVRQLAPIFLWQSQYLLVRHVLRSFTYWVTKSEYSKMHRVSMPCKPISHYLPTIQWTHNWLLFPTGTCLNANLPQSLLQPPYLTGAISLVSAIISSVTLPTAPALGIGTMTRCVTLLLWWKQRGCGSFHTSFLRITGILLDLIDIWCD